MIKNLVSPSQIFLWFRVYADNQDCLAKAAGIISLTVASNQPFYPLYLHAIIGTAAWPAWWTLLSTPFFIAVPGLARRNSFLGRALLPLAGIANTVLCVKLFGRETAVEIFLIPCLLLSVFLFRSNERIATLLLTALSIASYVRSEEHTSELQSH